jgi:hypothetical protein
LNQNYIFHILNIAEHIFELRSVEVVINVLYKLAVVVGIDSHVVAVGSK